MRRETYLVWQPDAGEFDCARRIEAVDAEQAAETWAAIDDRDSADYTIVGGDEAIVVVQAPDGTRTRWRVTGESVPSYSATEV